MYTVYFTATKHSANRQHLSSRTGPEVFVEHGEEYDLPEERQFNTSQPLTKEKYTGERWQLLYYVLEHHEGINCSLQVKSECLRMNGCSELPLWDLCRQNEHCFMLVVIMMMHLLLTLSKISWVSISLTVFSKFWYLKLCYDHEKVENHLVGT